MTRDRFQNGLTFLRRVVAYLNRRRREAGPLWRGWVILRRYTSHYRRARRVYSSDAAPTIPVYDVGVRAVSPDDVRGFIALPADFGARVSVVASAAAAALDRSADCNFFPTVPKDALTERSDDLPSVRSGDVISIRLEDPFAIDGLRELSDPLLAELERHVYGCHLVVDKLYVYRSPVCRQAPRASWLWHFDNHPREMLKVMVYLTDVTEGTAPFEYLEAEPGRALLGSPIAPLHNDSRVPAEAIERHIRNGARRRAVTGPAGTVLIFDDNVVHRATLAETGHRDVVVFQIRPATFNAMPRLDARWTGTFGDLDFNRDPNEMRPIPRPPKAAAPANA